MVGKAAASTLSKRYIRTIGDLAQQNPDTLHELLGKHGDLLWRYANGIDGEAVRLYGDRPEIKSVSRGRTFKRDLVESGEIRTALTVLSDEVARELRRHNLKGEVVSVQIRRPDMSIIQRQDTLDHHTFLQREIQEEAFSLLTKHWRIGDPIRALTVGVGRLEHADEVIEQLDMFDILSSTVAQESGKVMNVRSREKQEKLETLMDELRGRYGQNSITLGYQEIGIERGRRRE